MEASLHPQVSVAQSAEAADLKSAQCAFESHRRHVNNRKDEMLLTIMIFVILTFVWIVLSMAAIHNTLMKIAQNTALPTDMKVYSREDPKGR